MPDAATLLFALTYAGTLAVAALIFFGKFAALTILLSIGVRGIAMATAIECNNAKSLREACPDALEQLITVAQDAMKQQQWGAGTAPVIHPRRVPVNVHVAAHGLRCGS